MYGLEVARQITVSNEVYEMLLKRKGNKSFSQVIKESLCANSKKTEIMKYAGILKDQKKELDQLKKQIEEERETNYGRTFEAWMDDST